jgi:hypothetical protein
LAFSDSHSSSKKRSMNGAQFHPHWVGNAGGDWQVNKWLVEIRLVQCGEVGLVGGQVVDWKDCVLGADVGAVAAVDALVGVDEDLGDGAGSRVTGYGRNGGGGTLRNANKILGTTIGDDISHKMMLLARCQDWFIGGRAAVPPLIPEAIGVGTGKL